MPVEGYKSITVSLEVYQKLSKHAEKTNRTIPETIEHLLEKAEKTLRRAEKQTTEQLTQQAS